MSNKKLDSIKKEMLSSAKQLNEQQQKEFAWRCAIRLLPCMETEEALNFWDDAAGTVQEICEALDLMSYGGIYTEKIIRNKITKNSTETPEDLEQRIKAVSKNLFTEIAANIFDMVRELEHLDVNPEMSETYRERYDDENSYEFYDYDVYAEVERAISRASTSINVLAVAANVFKEQDSEKMGDNLKTLVDKIADVDRIVVVDISEISNDLNDVLNNKKPSFSKNMYCSSSFIYEFIATIKYLDLKEQAEIYTEIIENHFEMNIEALEKRIESILSNYNSILK